MHPGLTTGPSLGNQKFVLCASLNALYNTKAGVQNQPIGAAAAQHPDADAQFTLLFPEVFFYQDWQQEFASEISACRVC